MCKAHLAYSAPNLSCGCLLIEQANPLSALMVLKQRTHQYLIYGKQQAMIVHQIWNLIYKFTTSVCLSVTDVLEGGGRDRAVKQRATLFIV
jgi:hypothetical protein